MRGEGWSQGPKPDPYDFGRPSYSVVSRIPPNLAKNPFPKSDRLLVNGFAGQTLGVSCMQWALATTPAGIVFAILAITPIVIIPFAIVLEH